MPIRSNKNLESYYDRFSTSGAGGPPFVPEPEWTGGRGIWFGGYGGPSSYGSGGQPSSWGGQYQQGGYQPEPSKYLMHVKCYLIK